MWKAIRRLGRFGALIFLVGAAASGLLGGYLILEAGPWNGAELTSPAGFAMGLAHLGLSLLLGLNGVVLLVSGAPAPVRKTDDELRALLGDGKPHLLCLDCRTTVLVPPCEHCHQNSSCFEVRTQTDAENARALLGLDTLEGSPRA